VSFEKTAIFIQFQPAPPHSTPGFEGFDLMKSDSSFHRVKLAQDDKGTIRVSKKMRPVILPTH